MKRIWILLFAFAAAAVLMTACGRNRNDADTNSVQQTEQHETDRENDTENDRASEEAARTEDTDRGIMDDAGDMVSDVIEGGKDIVSDAADEGRDIVSDIAGTETAEEETTTDTSR